MKPAKMLKNIIKLIAALMVVLMPLYFFVGCATGGFESKSIQPVSEECEAEIIRASRIILPENARVVNVSLYHWAAINHYYVIKLEGIDDVYELKRLNSDNYIEECLENDMEINVIDDISALKGFTLYPYIKYFPKGAAATVYYDKNYVYLSIDSAYYQGKDVSDVFWDNCT